MRYTLHIDKAQERGYPRLLFDVPADTERIDICCSYPRSWARRDGVMARVSGTCVIDLALEDPDGVLFGSAGSDRMNITVSPLGSSAGFRSEELKPGRWRVIAGAYHVPENGVDVAYEITLTPKSRRLFLGETHAHSVASDGASTLAELLSLCAHQKLDFLCITDHNNVGAGGMYGDVTVLPGVEWTHYSGHAGFLGSAAPLPGSLERIDRAGAERFLRAAHSNGAFIALNHPFCPIVPWQMDLSLPFDGVEVWNGLMSERNERAIEWWHAQLCAGRRLPCVGGSDYHRPGLLGSVGMPCMCLYALSRSEQDLVCALKEGSGFIRYIPNGPGLDMRADDGAVMGGYAARGSVVTFSWTNLRAGDALRFISDIGEETLVCSRDEEAVELTRTFPTEARFARAELSRAYIPGMQPMRALIGNPIYFAE